MMLDIARKTDTKARAVFEILIRENQAMLMTYLGAAARDRHVADDLFQETMLVAWKKLDQFDHTRPFGPWLRGIAAKLVMAHFRKAKSDLMVVDEGTLEYLSNQLQHISQRPGDNWEDKIGALTHCIEALSEHYQRVIRLRYFEQVTTDQMATQTQTSVETIRKRLQRARVKLLGCLQRQEVVVEVTS